MQDNGRQFDIDLAKELMNNEISELMKCGLDYIQANQFARKKYSEIEFYMTERPETDPNFFNVVTNEEIPKKIVGEISTIQTIFLCSCGRLVLNAQKTSYNLMVNDESGAGKDWVTDKTLAIWPDDQIVKRTRITENVFTYWHNPKFEPDWSWDGKVFYNEDISTSVLNSDVFKVMASSGSKATVLVKQTPIDIEIVGKPVMIITAAAAFPNAENIRRFTMVNLDLSIDQTKAIMARQAEAARVGLSIEYDQKVRATLGKLQRVRVKIPFADIILSFFPCEHILMRTHFERFLDYIKASAAFHQFQRQKDEEGFLIAEPLDYDIARVALLKTTSNQIMLPLTKNQKKVLRIIEKMDKDFGTNTHIYWSVTEIEGKVTFLSDKWLRKTLDELADYGFLEKDSEKREESKKPMIVYKIKGITEVNIPSWDDIEKCATPPIPGAIVEQLYCITAPTCSDSVLRNPTIDTNDASKPQKTLKNIINTTSVKSNKIDNNDTIDIIDNDSSYNNEEEMMDDAAD